MITAPEWSQAEDNLLTDLWHRGFTDREASGPLGRTVAAINHRRQKLGLPSNRRSKRNAASSAAGLDPEKLYRPVAQPPSLPGATQAAQQETALAAREVPSEQIDRALGRLPRYPVGDPFRSDPRIPASRSDNEAASRGEQRN